MKTNKGYGTRYDQPAEQEARARRGTATGIITLNGVCDICGKARGGHNNHTKCSKIRQAQGFPGRKA